MNVLRESILGKLLMQVDEYDTRQDVVTSYMSDYVHMVYHAHSDEEHAVSKANFLSFFLTLSFMNIHSRLHPL